MGDRVFDAAIFHPDRTDGPHLWFQASALVKIGGTHVGGGIPTRSGQGQTGRRLQEKDASRQPLSFNPVGRAASRRPYSPNRLVF